MCIRPASRPCSASSRPSYRSRSTRRRPAGVHAARAAAGLAARVLAKMCRAPVCAGLDGGHAFLWNQPPGFDPASTLRVDRHIPEGSGEPGTPTRRSGRSDPRGRTMPATNGRSRASCTIAASPAPGRRTSPSTARSSRSPTGSAGGAVLGRELQLRGHDPGGRSRRLLHRRRDRRVRAIADDRPNRQRVGLQISTGGVPGAHTATASCWATSRFGDRPGLLVPGGGDLRDRHRYGGRPIHRRTHPAGVGPVDCAGWKPGRALRAQARLRRARPRLRDRQRAGPAGVSDGGQIQAASVREASPAAEEQPGGVHTRRSCLGRGLRVSLCRPQSLEARGTQRLVSAALRRGGNGMIATKAATAAPITRRRA